MTIFKLGKYKIDHKSKPFIIAELSANHNGSKETAFEIIWIFSYRNLNSVITKIEV